MNSRRNAYIAIAVSVTVVLLVGFCKFTQQKTSQSTSESASNTPPVDSKARKDSTYIITRLKGIAYPQWFEAAYEEGTYAIEFEDTR
jgi:hypothetical protein